MLDQNLAYRLVRSNEDIYAGSSHVRLVGLARATDVQVWDHALRGGLAIVSKNADFHQRSFVDGPPPKVIWIRLGNCSTDAIADLLRSRHPEIRAFLDDPASAFLALG